ncbi:unnamed protein product [Dracunculus medinensis]|uniref:Calmodulin-regulated spectrin-associated protein 1 n=1 Tax=Dracunculus medinensis TaxID=318479 RepID=A0A158Q5D6_DRAME|nr:unnamed protein product [Dracunculus medinensis]
MRYFQGKLTASVKWLVGRVYGKSVPDLLQNPVRVNDDNTFHLVTAVITGLTNASLYSNAAAKIFKDHSLINKSHGVVLRVLANHSIPLMISGEESNINETMLSSVQPFNQPAHLALIDALMISHMRSIITIERVVDAVQKYTTVDKREEPMDSVDALLFWINKICMLVRDDMEKYQATSKNDGYNASVIVPEMEDLYEDMCDGACICAVIAFYRPNDLNLREICFSDPMGLADCQYNLTLLKRFCQTLPCNCFYFEIEDILYLHECLQPNVNALLADLFYHFEDVEGACAKTPVDPISSRRFINSAGIPGLRMHNVSSTRVQQKGKLAQPGMIRDPLRSGDSRRYTQNNRPSLCPNDTTNFCELGSFDLPSNVGSNLSTGGIYIRSDSMPAASIRLALEEKRREHEKRRYLQTNQSQSERVQMQKDAFFTLMQRLEKQGSEGRSRAMSEYGTPSAREIKSLKETVEGLQKQLQKMSIQQEHLTRQFDGQRRMTHATSQPSIHSGHLCILWHYFGYLHEVMQQPSLNPYSTLPHNMVRSGIIQPQHTYAMPYANANNLSQMDSLPGQIICHPSDEQQMYPLTQMQMPSSFAPVSSQRFIHAMADPSHIRQSEIDLNTYHFGQMASQVSCMLDTSSLATDSANSFRLHQNNASSSRLDPPLELNRNLTNWGLTYKAGHALRPQRRTWENETFVKSDMDLVNQPNVVPYVLNDQDQKPPPVSNELPIYDNAQPLVYQQQSLPQLCSAQQLNKRKGINEQKPPIPVHQPSPPKDPSSPPPVNILVQQRQSTTGGSQFITREMEAKREALLAKTLKRREQIEQKVEELEAKNAERRLAEIEKQEAAEQRKRERDLQRQKILEDYKRKKMEKDLEMNGSAHNGRGHTLKLFSKYVPKSNRSIIINALQYSVFPGAVWDKQRNEVLSELAKSDSKHLLLLFRDQKCRYLGAYSWDQQSDTTHRIHGRGPSICNETMMNLMFKYDSGAKAFTQIPTKHLSATIDGFTLRDQYVQGPKIPHSSSILRKTFFISFIILQLTGELGGTEIIVPTMSPKSVIKNGNGTNCVHVTEIAW